MKIKIGIAIGVILVGFLGYVSSRNGHFHYERSGVINAPAEKIYPYLSDFKKGQLWNPYDQRDPTMKHIYNGPDSQVGSSMQFEGNREVGSGKLEILKLVPNQMVEIKLTMISPFHAENLVRYTLMPEGSGTRFSWSMEGDGGFMGKLMSVFIDCEKMVAGEFEKGISLLKTVVEGAR